MDTSYGQSQSYIPAADGPFKDWLANFATLIQADPAMYGLDASDATIISNYSTSYAAAYTAAKSPSTRTPNAVAQKDAVKASARASCRVYAMLIKTNGAVSNDAKIQLGLHVNDPTPTPIPAPTTKPMLNIVSSFSGEHTIRFADSLTPTSRAKPYGCAQIELYVFVGPTATIDPTQATFIGAFTRNPIIHEFPATAANQCATYFARWRTLKGLAGPWSLPVCMGIAFGGPVEQQMFYPTGGTPQAQGGQDLKIAA